MNCIDFRREALAQPLRLASAAGEHAAGCDSCGPFLARLRELDAELHQVMSVTAPDGLADRILVARGTRRGRAPWAWAIAATILLAAGPPVPLPGHDLGAGPWQARRSPT
jgi:hypothetical protein